MLDADDCGDVFRGDCTLTLYWLRSFGIRVSFSNFAISNIFSSLIGVGCGGRIVSSSVIDYMTVKMSRAVTVGIFRRRAVLSIYASTCWRSWEMRKTT